MPIRPVQPTDHAEWQRMSSGKTWQDAGRFMPCMECYVPHTMPRQSLAGLHHDTDTTLQQCRMHESCL